jgi:hypothetical protein
MSNKLSQKMLKAAERSPQKGSNTLSVVHHNSPILIDSSLLQLPAHQGPNLALAKLWLEP